MNRAGLGPKSSEKMGPGPLENKDSVRKLTVLANYSFLTNQGADFMYDNSFFKKIPV